MAGSQTKRHKYSRRQLQSSRDWILLAARTAVEILERRLLLSSDLSYTQTASTAFDATLSATPTTIQLFDSTSMTVLQSVPLASFSGNVSISGSVAGDALNFDPTLSSVSLHNITVNLTGSGDIVNFNGDLTTNLGTLQVNASTIAVSADAVLSTQPAAGSGSGNPGPITFTGTNVSLATGAQLQASVPMGDPDLPGNITIATTDSPAAQDLTTPLATDTRSATVSLAAGSVISGRNVTITTNAATQTRWGDVAGYSENSIANQLVSDLTSLSGLSFGSINPITGETKIENATGQITLTSATIDATGYATINSNSTANANFTAVGINNIAPSDQNTQAFAITLGYAQTMSTADVELDGTTSITAGGDVNIQTDSTASSDVISNSVGNAYLSPMADVLEATSVGVALNQETSTVSTSPQSVVQSQSGNVAINANGTGNTETSGYSQVFQDGASGIVVGVSVDKANITSTINGTVSAPHPTATPGMTFNAAAVVNVANNSITLSGINADDAITRGEQLTYNSGPGQAIGGLTNGTTYTVADVLQTNSNAQGTLTQTFTLANTLPLHLDASQTSPASTQTLSQLELSTFPSSAVAKDSNGNIQISNSALTVPLVTGDTVTYTGPNSTVLDPFVTASFAQSASGDTITRTDGGTNWVDLGLLVGEQIVIVGASGTDNGTFTIKAISADQKTLTLNVSNFVTPGVSTGFTVTSLPTMPAQINNLSPDTQYTVTVNNGKVNLADPSNSGTPIAFNNSGAGIQGFELVRNVKMFSPSTAVNSSNDTITIPSSGYATGNVVVYHTDAALSTTQNIFGYPSANPSSPVVIGTATIPDAPISGLQDGFIYYVTVVDANHIRLSASPGGALSAAVIALTPGSGNQTLNQPDTTSGVAITATYTANNAASAGVEFSGSAQNYSDGTLNTTQDADNVAAALSNIPDFSAILRSAVDSKFNVIPAQGPQPQAAQATGIPFTFSATFAMNSYQHTVETIIGPTAIIKSGGNVLISSTIQEFTQSDAVAATNGGQLDGVDTSATGEPRSDTEPAVAFIYGTATNTTESIISSNAVVDASDAISITANTSYPLLQYSPVNNFNPSVLLNEEDLQAYSEFLAGDLGLTNNLFNSLVTSLAGKPTTADMAKFTIGAGIDLEFMNNTAVAEIQNGAMVNQDGMYRTLMQSVSINAINSSSLINAAGQAVLDTGSNGLLPQTGGPLTKEGNLVGTLSNVTDALAYIANPLGATGVNVIGPAVIVILPTNTTTALIESGAMVYTAPAPGGSGLNVNASTNGISVSIAQTGARASDFGLSVSVTVDVQTDLTVAGVQAGAILTGGGLNIAAADTLNRYGIDGAFIQGLKDGVGISVGVNDISRTTSAYIGGLAANAPAVNLPNQLIYVAAANHGNIFELALAGTELIDASEKNTAGQPVIPSNANAQESGFKIAAGLSVAVNEGAENVSAFVENVNVNATLLSVTATTDTQEQSLVVGGALGNTSSGTQFGIGGALAINNISGGVTAYIMDSADVTTGPLIITATDQSTICADGGGVALMVSEGNNDAKNISVGIGVSINSINLPASAYFQTGSISAFPVLITAIFTPTISGVTIGGAGAVSNGSNSSSLNIAGAGAGTLNNIYGGATAFIDSATSTNGAGVIAAGQLIVNATDNATITADAGAVALALSLAASGKSSTNLSFAVSVAINQITDTDTAYMNGSNASVGGMMNISAGNASTINALTIGGAIAVQGNTNIGLSGGGSGNTINNTVSAYIHNANSLSVPTDVSGPIIVAATDAASITADGGGFGLALSLAKQGMNASVDGSVGIGAAVNMITATTTADIENANALADTVLVTATSSPTIKALTMGGAGAATVTQGSAFNFAGAGAGSGNSITDTVDADISETISGQSTSVQSTTGDVQVLANDNSNITADAGAIALALGISQGSSNINLSVGVSAAVNSITPEVTAEVSHATVTSKVDTQVEATNTDSITALTIAGAGAVALSTGESGFGLSLAGAGTGSGNNISGGSTAEITNASNVSAGSTLTVSTTDTSAISATAISGSLAATVGEGGSVAIGIAISQNMIQETDEATIIGGTADAMGDIDVTATADPVIDAVTVGVAVSLTVNSGEGVALAGSGDGAVSTNNITDTVIAEIIGGAQVGSTDGSVMVKATDSAMISANSGGGSLAVSASPSGFTGALAISAALSNNTTNDATVATINGNGTTVNAGNEVDVKAASDDTIQALAVSIAAAVAITDPTQGFALALAGGASQSNNSITNKIDANVTSAKATATNDVNVDATDTPTITATVPAVAIVVALGVGISIGVSLSDDMIDDDVDATAYGATLRSNNGNVNVEALSNDSVTATGTAVAVSIAIGGAGQGVEVTTSVGGHTNASIGGLSAITAADAVNVTATSTAVSSATANGGGAGLLDIGVVSADAEISQGTGASVTDSATVNAASLNVLTYGVNQGDPALSARTATSMVTPGQVAVAGGEGGTATSNITGIVQASIGQNTMVNVGGAVAVSALSSSTATSDAPGGSGGGLTVSVLSATSTVSGATDATADGVIHAGSLSVTANAAKITTATMLVANVSIAGGAGGSATATDSAATNAAVHGRQFISGPVAILANSSTMTMSNASGGAGGALSATGMISTSTSSGATEALADGRISAGSLSITSTAVKSTEADLLVATVAGAGGAGGSATATDSAATEAMLTTPMGSDTITGAVTVSANSSNTVTSNAPGGSGGGIAIAALIASSTLSGATIASANGQINAGSLSVNSNSFKSTHATMLVASVALAGGAGGSATATDSSETDATLSGTEMITGAVTVMANSSSMVMSSAMGGAGGGLSATGMISTATLSGATNATSDGQVSGGSLSITSTAGKTTDAELLVAAVAVAGGAGGNATATDSADTDAIQTGQATVTGSAVVSANSSNTVISNAPGGSGGGIAIAALLATSKLSGATNASAGQINAGSLSVMSNSVKSTDATILAASVALAGGAGGNATAIDSSDTDATLGGNDMVSGAVIVSATSSETTTGTATGGSGGIISAGGLVADASSQGTTQATLNPMSNLSAGSLNISAGTMSRVVTANQASGSAVVAGVGVFVVEANTNISGNTLATLGVGSTVTTPTGGFIDVIATDANTSATSTAMGGTGGLVGVSVFQASAQVGSAATPVLIDAVVGDGANLSTGGLTVSATSTDSTSSTLLSVGVGAVGVGTASGPANTYTSTTAEIGTSAPTAVTYVSASGDVMVLATSTTTATTNMTGGGGGGVGIAAITGNSNASSATTALVAGGARVTAGGNVTVSADILGTVASTTVLAGFGGVIGVGTSSSTATSIPTALAAIGPGAWVSAGGNFSLLSTVDGASNDSSQSSGGGGVDVGVADANSTYTPSSNAEIGTGAMIKAGGNVTVNSNLSDAPAAPPPSDDILAVNTSNSSVTFNYPLTTGDTVVYNPSGSPIGGLTANQSYNVIVVTPGQTIQFGDMFSADTQVNPLTDIITFTSPPNLTPGEAVEVFPNGGNSIFASGQITPTVYYVQGVYSDPNDPSTLNPLEIRLASTYAAATANESSLLKPDSGVSANTITVPGSSFTNGQAITYRSSDAQSFETQDVDVNVVTDTYQNSSGMMETGPDIQRDANGNGEHFNTYNIFMPNHNFSTGDAVTYENLSGSPIGNLISGDTYYVIVLDANTIQLAQSYYQAVGLAANVNNNNAAVAVTPIMLSIPVTGSQEDEQSLSRDLTGLNDQQTYYVTNASGGTFQLALTPGGSPIAVSDSETVTAYQADGMTVAFTTMVTDREGAALFGTLGVDLVAGSGSQSLVIELTSSGSGTQQLLGANGVPLSTLSPVTGIGTSSATAKGGSGGGIDVNVPTATLNVTPVVTASVDGGASIMAGGTVDIEAISDTDSTSYANTDGGGLLTVGEADATTNVTGAMTTTTVGAAGDNATIIASGDVTISSASNHDVSSTAGSHGGGFISARLAEDNATLSGQTQTTVTGSVTSGGLLSVLANGQITGYSNADAYSVGEGAGADADYKNGTGVNVNLPLTVTIGSGSTLLAQADEINATVSSVNVTAIASATAYDPILLGVATAYSNAYANVVAGQTVNINASAGMPTTITGTNGVDIQALSFGVSVTRSPYALAVAIIPPQSAVSNGSTSTGGVVSAFSDDATIVAGVRNQANTSLATDAAIPDLSLLVFADLTTWNANVTILAQDPVLVVNSSGVITADVGVTATQSGNTVTVAPIVDPGAGQILFEGLGLVTGSLGTFTFDQTFDSVNITVDKGNLVLGGITTYSAGNTGIEPKVTINVPGDLLQFNVADNFAVTTVNIQANDPGAGNIELTGLIDNPAGTTTLTATGSIYSKNFAMRQGVIQTNQLFINAGKEVGGTDPGTQDRIPINIVEAQGLPALISIIAGTDLYVGLQGLDRDPTSTGTFTTTLSSTPSLFQTGGLADIDLLGGVQQTTVSGTADDYGIQVYETGFVIIPITGPLTTIVTNHFRISTLNTASGSIAPVAWFGSGANLIPTTFTLGLVQAATSINIYKDPMVTSLVNIEATTNLVPGPLTRNINSNTNGFIALRSTVGDMPIGLAESTTSNVTLTSVSGSIIDLPLGLTTTGAVGVNISLYSDEGYIGTEGSVFNINSSDPTTGEVIAVAVRDIYLVETAGTLNIGMIESETSNVTLYVTDGALVDADAGTNAHVIGNVITFYLDAQDPSVGDVGTVGDDVFIDSSYSAMGGLHVEANGRVGITQTQHQLYVLSITGTGDSSLPDVFLTTTGGDDDTNSIIISPGFIDVDDITFTSADDFTDTLPTNTFTAEGTTTVKIDNAGLFSGIATLSAPISSSFLAFIGGVLIDHFYIGPEMLLTSAAITVDGQPPVYPTYPGDTLTPLSNNLSTGTTTVTSVMNGSGYVTFTAGYSTINFVSIEQTESPPPTLPEVAAVYAYSTNWSPTFADYVDDGLANPAAFGYPIPDGTLQQQTLPWVNINELKITFTENVTISSLSDFSITAAPGWLALGIPVGTLPTLTGFTYDPSTFTATLMFNNVFPASVFDLNITAAGVVNSDNMELDGEWTNDVTIGDSGNGMAGGDFSFRIFILPGDTVDDSGFGTNSRTVNATDAQEVRNTQNGFVLSSTGAVGYDARADLDGSGFINTNDSQYERDQQNAIIVYPTQTSPGFWMGTGDGVSATSPKNWSDDTVPTSADNVVVGSGFNGIDLTSGSLSVPSIAALSPVQILAGGTLTVNELSQFNDGLAIDSGGTLVNAATSTDSDPILVTGLNIAAGGVLDLGMGAMDVQGGSLSDITAKVASGYSNGAWTGSGITSSAARGDSNYLTAVGVIVNNDGLGNRLYGMNSALGLFNGYDSALNDVLVKYTWYGDANLDGSVDGTDYSRIDNGALNHLTGWFNGDFNYDGVINGSDYTLIDNAYNRQGAKLEAAIAAPAALPADPTDIAANSVTTPAPAAEIAVVAPSATLLRKKPNPAKPRRDDEENYIAAAEAVPASVLGSTPPAVIAARFPAKTADPVSTNSLNSLTDAVDDSPVKSLFSVQPIVT